VVDEVCVTGLGQYYDTLRNGSSLDYRSGRGELYYKIFEMVEETSQLSEPGPLLRTTFFESLEDVYVLGGVGKDEKLRCRTLKVPRATFVGKYSGGLLCPTCNE
jgi:hypothetical protein